MKRFDTRTVVEPGLYFNFRRLRFRSLDRSGRLPGNEDDVYHRVPLLVLLVAGPLVGLAYVIFLPVVGVAMSAAFGVRKLADWTTRAGGAIAQGFRRSRPTHSPHPPHGGQTPGEVGKKMARGERHAA